MPIARSPLPDGRVGRFEVPEGMEAKYRNNDHYETDDAPAPAPKPARKRAAPKPEAPKIQTDGWEDDE